METCPVRPWQICGFVKSKTACIQLSVVTLLKHIGNEADGSWEEGGSISKILCACVLNKCNPLFN